MGDLGPILFYIIVAIIWGLAQRIKTERPDNGKDVAWEEIQKVFSKYPVQKKAQKKQKPENRPAQQESEQFKQKPPIQQSEPRAAYEEIQEPAGAYILKEKLTGNELRKAIIYAEIFGAPRSRKSFYKARWQR